MTKIWLPTLLLAAGVAAGCSTARSGQTEAPSDPQVMLVSSYHLANNNRDLINIAIDDVLSPHRQEELERFVDNLAQWRATKIAIEWDRSDQAGLDRRYARYLSGELELTANGRDQIGFRLAKKLGHEKVYAVDWNESAPGDQAQYDFIEWARRNDQNARFNAFVEEGQRNADRIALAMRGRSISEWYYDLNRPEARQQDHRQYFEIATFRSNDENPGAAWVGAWYARNLRIFNNLREILGPEERLLVLYGAGHVYLLDRFLRESGVAVSVDPRLYIRGE